MSTESFKKAESKAQIINELTKIVKQQLSGEMDWVRARAYWDSRLPEITPDLLAEALSYAIYSARQHK